MVKSDIGVFGLAVMGENIALNIESKGYKVSVYNRNGEVTKKFIQSRGAGRNIYPGYSLKDFIDSLAIPRKIIMMVRAGDAVDQVIDSLLPHLSPGDILLDGGNSNHTDTARRLMKVEGEGLLYVGTGISGGEEGALNGPSLMPGGSVEAWPQIENIFAAISAKAKDGAPCSSWIGPEGSGHFVKMVHNGIEYADMQIISEGYFLLKNLFKLDNTSISSLFRKWNEGELESYLTGITYKILDYREDNGEFLIDKILDSAGQKGTGKWSVINAMELSIPFGVIAAALFERSLSFRKELRVKASDLYQTYFADNTGILKNMDIGTDDIMNALYVSKIISYSQGFSLLSGASGQWGWNLKLREIARIWRNGCIIRSSFLDHIANAYDKDPDLEHLLLADYFKDQTGKRIKSFRKVVSTATLAGVSVPALSSALNYFTSLTTKRLPANLIQAQRDFFGAHSFERIDRPGGEFFHENWTGKGGEAKSGRYNA
ncbi:MAG: decarboxylating NADP(+)-dependent phosphogluconate dehydrogenase [Bacteroidales bacterium]|nr:decarboxylating NADP(+)-dependent phosphogluconate dehydrogenase [Bacteroidales bacterium]MDD3989779.1 decarboxylating NADP(+)-dependent phosphogluconate dehydrogenase [Bacteroidales bacterium]MDD4639386.1 decarboxylating NADP(+)-dependent phosphogluconate dehydrogenase [Bacteroidales bacterium]